MTQESQKHTQVLSKAEQSKRNNMLPKNSKQLKVAKPLAKCSYQYSPAKNHKKQ